MISRPTCSFAKENVVFPRLFYCNSRCSQTCHWCFPMLQELSSTRPDLLSAHPQLSSTSPSLLQVLPVSLKASWNALEESDSGIDTSMLTLHIRSDTPGCIYWTKQICLMWVKHWGRQVALVEGLPFEVHTEWHWVVITVTGTLEPKGWTSGHTQVSKNQVKVKPQLTQKIGVLANQALRCVAHSHDTPAPVTPLVSQVYFQDHTGSLKNPNMDTLFEIMNYHSGFLLGSLFQICSLIGNNSITLPSYQ
jgi:hypothetical protein